MASWWSHSCVKEASWILYDSIFLIVSNRLHLIEKFAPQPELSHPQIFSRKYCQTYVIKTTLNAALQCPKVHVLAQSTHVSIATFLQLNALIYGTVKLLGIHFKQSEHSILFTPQNSNLQLEHSIHAIWHELNN